MCVCVSVALHTSACLAHELSFIRQSHTASFRRLSSTRPSFNQELDFVLPLREHFGVLRRVSLVTRPKFPMCRRRLVLQREIFVLFGLIRRLWPIVDADECKPIDRLVASSFIPLNARQSCCVWVCCDRLNSTFRTVKGLTKCKQRTIDRTDIPTDESAFRIRCSPPNVRPVVSILGCVQGQDWSSNDRPARA